MVKEAQHLYVKDRGIHSRLINSRFFSLCYNEPFWSPSDKAKENKSYVSKLPRTCFSVRVWFSKILGLIFFFFAWLIFASFFMNLLVKIYKKRYDRQNETLWTTDFFNSVFYLVSCSSKIKFHILKLWTTQIWHICCSEKKNTLKKPAFRSGDPICHELWDIAFIFKA